MSDHRAAASAAASPPGASATLIASCRAEPLAYASTSLDRRPAEAAERRRPERAINAIRPARTRTPSRTHSQVRLVPEEAAGAAEPVAAAVGADVTVTVTPGLGEAVAVRLGKLPIELLMVPPHPATSNPAARRITERESPFAERRMLILPRCAWPTAGAYVGRRQDRCRACPGGPAAQPCDPQPAWRGGFCLRHHRDCSAPRLGADLAISARQVPLRHPRPSRFDHGE